MTAAFPQSLLPRLRASVQDSLTCQADTVQLALEMHFAQRLGALRGLLACCLTESEAAQSVGVALDLIHVSLQRLHLRLEDGDGIPALLGTGACVLAGDYLTSAAFKVLIRCNDLAVLDQVARTITRTCEADNRTLADDPRGRSRARRRAALDLALAGAAAEAGARLAGRPEWAPLARRLGRRLQAGQALNSLREHSDGAQAQAYGQRSQRALTRAGHTAALLDQRTGTERATQLVAFVTQALAQARPELPAALA